MRLPSIFSGFSYQAFREIRLSLKAALFHMIYGCRMRKIQWEQVLILSYQCLSKHYTTTQYKHTEPNIFIYSNKKKLFVRRKKEFFCIAQRKYFRFFEYLLSRKQHISVSRNWKRRKQQRAHTHTCTLEHFVLFPFGIKIKQQQQQLNGEQNLSKYLYYFEWKIFSLKFIDLRCIKPG